MFSYVPEEGKLIRRKTKWKNRARTHHAKMKQIDVSSEMEFFDNDDFGEMEIDSSLTRKRHRNSRENHLRNKL